MNDWKIVEELFHAATEIPANERPAFLERACGGDDGLRAEVESLLAFDSGKTSPFATLVEAGAARFFHTEGMLGARVGSYQITESLGHGGMGAVYLAERADDQFSRKAAVKFVRKGMDTPGAVERFLRERQILANLDHPYIGKLLDGGTTDDGIPYFVMEYIQGTPIDEYCNLHGLSVDARCELFRKVCEAVAYAHRSLVVHRDLKPTNILVNEDGAPVLLDFGIAKLVDESGAQQHTQTGGTWMLTPDYASPEQIQGLPTTTSTDVYSLGVVLYQLLTGAKPFRVDSTTPLEIARTICETLPCRPSSVAGSRKVSADLDNIVLMALRKEPERRYSSVDQFREDIFRYLKGRPVIAREDTFTYRAGKFVRRNRAAVVAGALVSASLFGAVAMTAHEARRAGQALVQAEAQRNIALAQGAQAKAERNRAEAEHVTADQQRELATRAEQLAIEHAKEAEAQRQNAQQRLADLLELGRHSLFDVQDTLSRLPGALEARRDIIVTTRQYLDGLDASAKDDPAVLAMLVTGYTQTGDVLGYPGAPNLGDRNGAIEAWHKARELLSRLKKLQGSNKRTELQDLGLHQRIGVVQESDGNTKVALLEYMDALGIAHRLAHDYPNDINAVAQTGIIEHNVGTAMTQLHDPAADDHIRAEVQAYEKTTTLAPDDLNHRLGLASAIAGLGQMFIAEHRLEEGLAEFRRALAIRESVLKLKPGDGIANSGIAKTWLRIAGVLAGPWQENLGDTKGAMEACEKAVAVYEALVLADGGNRKAKGDLATALVYAGVTGRGTPESLPRLHRAAGMLADLRKADPKQVTYRTDSAIVHEYIGHALRETGDLAGAIAQYRLSLDAKDNPAVAARLVESERGLVDVAGHRQ
jgi:tetratricopeptide (TPR) repeat protein